MPQDTPTVWNLRVLFVVGSVLAGVACISSLLLLKMCLESWQDDSFFQWVGLGGISYGQITTSIFLKVAVSDFLTLFSARAGEAPFWSSSPAFVLVAAAGFALATSTCLACYWPLSRPDGIPTLGLWQKPPAMLPVFIWIYCIVWWFLQDLAKVLTFKFLKAYNVFGYNDSGMCESMIKYHAALEAQAKRDSPNSINKKHDDRDRWGIDFESGGEGGSPRNNTNTNSNGGSPSHSGKTGRALAPGGGFLDSLYKCSQVVLRKTGLESVVMNLRKYNRAKKGKNNN